MKSMTDRMAITRLTAVGWAAVLVAAGFLTVQTLAAIERIGLTGARPPLSPFETGVRIVFVLAALGLLRVFRDVLERLALGVGAAAAGSSALYGFGLRSPALSSFRLLSHVALYALAMVVALRRLRLRA